MRRNARAMTIALIVLALSGCASIDRMSGKDDVKPLTPQRELQMARETHIAVIETAITLHEGDVLDDEQISQVYRYSKVAKTLIDRWDSLIQEGDNTEAVKGEYTVAIDKMRGVIYE